MTFKPMKGDDADLSRLKFPYMVTPKLDGHRCLIKDGVALTSSLKPFPNKFIQAFFASGEYDGLDGELIVGEPTSPNVFRDTSSGVRRVEGEPDFTFWAFDRWDLGDRSARERHATLYDIVLPIDERSNDVAEDGKQAAQLLCAMVKGAPSYLMVPRPILEWYLRHLQVDLMVAQDPRMALADPGPREAIIAEIEAVAKALAVAQH